jgi:hypothetical protein
VSTTYVGNDLNQYTRVYRYGSPQAALFPSYDADGNLSRFALDTTDTAGRCGPLRGLRASPERPRQGFDVAGDLNP